MRKQTRPTEPEVLKRNSAKWNSQWSDLKSKNSKAPFIWYQHQGKSAREWILPTLREMNQEHCSFCDGFPLVGTSTEPIEHFRPKSIPGFYDQAYTWTNLYYCCEVCNSCKGERWDNRLLAPDAKDYEFHLYFMYDFESGAIAPNPTASQEAQSQAECTIRLYGLDSTDKRRRRRLELRKWQKTNDGDIDSFGFRDFLA